MKFIGLPIILLIICNSRAAAQLWTGSLGDPVMTFDFGTSANPGVPLPAGITSYKYTSQGCPEAGEYTLGNQVFSCYNNNGQTLVGDYTPDDVGGYYMLVNAQSSKGTFYTSAAGNLCPNTKYEFSVWIKNALKPTACFNVAINPNLTFTVETKSGTVLSTYNTLGIVPQQTPAWTQYGLVFSTTATITDVVLKISNSAADGCGNVLAIDEVAIKPCGPLVSAALASNGLTISEICEGKDQSIVLAATYSNEFIKPVFQWQYRESGPWQDVAGANTKTYVRPPNVPGSYLYRVKISEAGSQCSVVTNEVLLNVLKTPFVQATSYVYGCLGGDVTLLASGANVFLWTGPNGFTSTKQSPVLEKLTYKDAGMYKVTGVTQAGCVNSDSTTLQVFPNAIASSSQGKTICEGSSTTLVASGGVRYYWEPSKGLSSDTLATPVASPVENTLYKVKATNQYGCSDYDSIEIKIWKKVVVNAGSDLKTRVGLPTRLNGSIGGSDVTFFWTPSISGNFPESLTPVVNPPQTTTYTLHGVSTHGCAGQTDNVVVKVYDKVVIPTAFSPNGDGINDTWFIDPLEFFMESTTEVYDRFGRLAYLTRGYTSPWDGTSRGNPLPVGVYYYIIDLGVKNQPKLTGSVTIIR